MNRIHGMKMLVAQPLGWTTNILFILFILSDQDSAGSTRPATSPKPTR
ncbi:hypothetical protein BH20VER2_BH20VER2_16540 [soil metagenome]